jgi:hypothetical protein
MEKMSWMEHEKVQKHGVLVMVASKKLQRVKNSRRIFRVFFRVFSRIFFRVFFGISES